MTVEVLASHELTAALAAEVRALLDRAFEGEFSDEDWQHALGGWHVLARERGAVVAHAAVVPRVLHVDGRPVEVGYVEAVATDPAHQRTGLGTAVLREAGALVAQHFAMGALSTGAHALYARLGWERWLGPTSVRDGDREVRTPEEDDGVMVLRLPGSADVDRTSPLACEARTGDDW